MNTHFSLDTSVQQCVSSVCAHVFIQKMTKCHLAHFLTVNTDIICSIYTCGPVRLRTFFPPLFLSSLKITYITGHLKLHLILQDENINVCCLFTLTQIKRVPDQCGEQIYPADRMSATPPVHTVWSPVGEGSLS